MFVLRRAFVGQGWFAWVVVVAFSGDIHAEDLRTVKQAAIDAAQRRQETVHQFHAAFDVRPVQQLPPAAQIPTVGQSPPPPPSATPPRNTVIVADSSIRYEDNSYIRPFRGDNLGLHSREISVYNGRVAKRYFPDIHGMFGIHLGFLVAKGPPRSIATPFMVPLLLNFRPRDSYIGTLAIDEATPTTTVDKIDDRLCRLFAIDLTAGRELSIWLDPERHYVPCRVARTHPGTPVWQVDITYTEHPKVGWVPNGWVMKRHGEIGQYVESWQATDVAIRINEPVDADVFELAFPTRTQVHDEETSQQYLVQDDGSWREISPTTGRYLDELPQPQQPFPRYGYLIIVGTLALTLFLANRWFGRRGKSS